jgi:hypothetical protein
LKHLGIVSGALALLATVGGALGESLSSAHPDLRAALQARLDGIPSKTTAGLQKRERALLSKAIGCLDRDSVSLSTDLSLGSRTLAPLVALDLLGDEALGPPALGLRDDLVARVQARRQGLGMVRAYFFDPLDLAKFDLCAAKADAVVDAAALAPDPAAEVRALKKAVRTIKKGEALAARATRALPYDDLDLVITRGKPPFLTSQRLLPGDPAVKEFAISYETAADTVVIDLTVTVDGFDQVMRFPKAHPGVGTFLMDFDGPTLVDAGAACNFTAVNDVDLIHLTLTAWDPQNGYAAGRFNLLYHDLDERFYCVRGYVGIFTQFDVVVKP